MRFSTVMTICYITREVETQRSSVCGRLLEQEARERSGYNLSFMALVEVFAGLTRAGGGLL